MHSGNAPDYQNSSSNPSAGPPYDGQPVSSSPVFGSSPGPWHTGLFGCFEDVPNCLITCFCPAVTFGQVAEIVDKGKTSCAASAAIFGLIQYFSCMGGCLYSCFYRSKLRNQYALVESPCADCCVHCSCLCCALCQEYRELKKQGFDMSIEDLAKGKRVYGNRTMSRSWGLKASPLRQPTTCALLLMVFFLYSLNCLGWEGNVERKRHEMQMAQPMAQGGMTR